MPPTQPPQPMYAIVTVALCKFHAHLQAISHYADITPLCGFS